MIRVLTFKDENFILKNYLKLSSREIGAALGIPRGTVTSFLKRNGISIPKNICKLFKDTAIQKRYDAVYHPADIVIKELYLELPLKNLADLIGRSGGYVSGRYKKLQLKVPEKIKKEFIEYGRIKKGNIPQNKGKKQTEYMSPETIERTKATRFKKGNLPGNTLFDGAISIRREHQQRRGGHITKYIRISKGKWKELQIYNWEKVNGPVPKGFVLACKNGDRLNCEISNWYLLSMADNVRRNSIHNYPQEIVNTIMLMGSMRRKINTKLKKLSNEK
jgi:hypothetical protein